MRRSWGVQACCPCRASLTRAPRPRACRPPLLRCRRAAHRVLGPGGHRVPPDLWVSWLRGATLGLAAARCCPACLRPLNEWDSRGAPKRWAPDLRCCRCLLGGPSRAPLGRPPTQPTNSNMPLLRSKEVRHPFTAHPKVDPQTGECFWFGYSVEQKPYCEPRAPAAATALPAATPPGLWSMRGCRAAVAWPAASSRPAHSGAPARCPSSLHRPPAILDRLVRAAGRRGPPGSTLPGAPAAAHCERRVLGLERGLGQGWRHGRQARCRWGSCCQGRRCCRRGCLPALRTSTPPLLHTRRRCRTWRWRRAPPVVGRFEESTPPRLCCAPPLQMMHDMALTQNHVLLLDVPLVFDPRARGMAWAAARQRAGCRMRARVIAGCWRHRQDVCLPDRPCSPPCQASHLVAPSTSTLLAGDDQGGQAAVLLPAAPSAHRRAAARRGVCRGDPLVRDGWVCRSARCGRPASCAGSWSCGLARQVARGTPSIACWLPTPAPTTPTITPPPFTPAEPFMAFHTAAAWEEGGAEGGPPAAIRLFLCTFRSFSLVGLRACCFSLLRACCFSLQACRRAGILGSSARRQDGRRGRPAVGAERALVLRRPGCWPAVRVRAAHAVQDHMRADEGNEPYLTEVRPGSLIHGLSWVLRLQLLHQQLRGCVGGPALPPHHRATPCHPPLRCPGAPGLGDGRGQRGAPARRAAGRLPRHPPQRHGWVLRGCWLSGGQVAGKLCDGTARTAPPSQRRGRVLKRWLGSSVQGSRGARGLRRVSALGICARPPPVKIPAPLHPHPCRRPPLPLHVRCCHAPPGRRPALLRRHRKVRPAGGRYRRRHQWRHRVGAGGPRALRRAAPGRRGLVRAQAGRWLRCHGWRRWWEGGKQAPRLGCFERRRTALTPTPCACACLTRRAPPPKMTAT